MNSVVKSFLIFPIKKVHVEAIFAVLFSEICSGPGASSQIGIWEYATNQVIRVIESVTGGLHVCVSVCMQASRSPECVTNKNGKPRH